MSLRDDFREFAFALDAAWLDHAWDIEGDVFKTSRGKIFLISKGDDATASATVKVTPAEASAALTLPFVRPAAWPRGWITATVTNEVERDVVLEWVARSYELVSTKR